MVSRVGRFYVLTDKPFEVEAPAEFFLNCCKLFSLSLLHPELNPSINNPVALGKPLALSKKQPPMYKLKYLTAILIAVTAFGLQQAQAHLLDPFTFFTNNPIGNPSNELAYLQTHGGGIYQPTYLPATSQYLGKFNDNGSIENGAIINISQYVTVTFTTGQTWHVEWNLTGSGFTMDGMLIKDGKIQGSGEVYKFYGVSADETLIGSGDVTLADVGRNGRDISHITFFGSPGGQVPDGGTTVMLLGAALGSLGMARRFLKR